MAESLKGTILRFECLQLCQAWRNKSYFHEPVLALKTCLSGNFQCDVYASVEGSLNGLDGLAGEPMVVYTTEPQRR